MQKLTFLNHFEASPWNKSVIALDARQVVIAKSCVCVGHSGRPRACGPRATLVTYTHAAFRNNHLSLTVRGDNYYMFPPSINLPLHVLQLVFIEHCFGGRRYNHHLFEYAIQICLSVFLNGSLCRCKHCFFKAGFEFTVL